MKLPKAILYFVILPAAGLIFSGCLNLKPAVDVARFFVLAPDRAMTTGSPAPNPGLGVGIGRVQVADYLRRKQMVLRKGSHEVEYSEHCYWAEFLDKGAERVLGVNLASCLGSTNVFTSAWRRSDVAAELYVSMQRFESDPHGQVVLEASWRITNPGASQSWRMGRSRIVKQGPPPATDPDGAVATLGLALGDLSREVAAALCEVSRSRSPSTSSDRGQLEP